MQRYAYLSRFACLGETCEDTCCKGWGMQVDAQHLQLYAEQAPELLKSVEDSPVGPVMRRDEATDYCVKFTKGLCGIHAERGSEFLGDACYFFPRSVRALGDTPVMAATMACPEITRLALFTENPFTRETLPAGRLPHTIVNYLPQGLTEAQAIACTDSLLDQANQTGRSAERSMAVVMYLLFQLHGKEPPYYPIALSTYGKIAEGLMPLALPRTGDPYFLLQTLRGLMHAAPKAERNRLELTFAAMEAACSARIDRSSLDIYLNVGQEQAAARLQARYTAEWRDYFAPILRQYLQGQIALGALPFGGFGRNLCERATILCVRFATVRLALMAEAALNGLPDSVIITRIVQSISRLMDHLADPELSIRLYYEAGWDNEARLRALAGDC